MAGAGSVLTRCFSVHLFTNVYVEIKNLPMQVFERAREKDISGEKQKQGVAVFGCESRKDSSKQVAAREAHSPARHACRGVWCQQNFICGYKDIANIASASEISIASFSYISRILGPFSRSRVASTLFHGGLVIISTSHLTSSVVRYQIPQHPTTHKRIKSHLR